MLVLVAYDIKESFSFSSKISLAAILKKNMRECWPNCCPYFIGVLAWNGSPGLRSLCLN